MGLERAIPNSETIWQVEQNKFCQQVLAKHWPNSKIYNDVREIKKNNVEPVDILIGGFPCQDLSTAGKGAGINGNKSGLWWDMFRIIGDLLPSIIIMENVPAITFRGMESVLGALASIGYDSEWEIISARQFGAPHIRERWFCIAYPSGQRFQKNDNQRIRFNGPGEKSLNKYAGPSGFNSPNKGGDFKIENYWDKNKSPARIRRIHNGIPSGMDGNRIKALGNAIVPQCSEYIGKRLLNSGLLELLNENK